jgi:lipid A ethanolaminephosphotransferase
MAWHLLLYAVLPLLLLWRVQPSNPGPGCKALAWRLGSTAAGAGGAGGRHAGGVPALLALMRNQKELRYLITPAMCCGRWAWWWPTNTRGAAKPRQVIGLDAQARPAPGHTHRPLLVVLVVGETARAANWGLNGYARQTTPQLASAGGQLCRGHQLRHQHRGLAALHVCARGPARLRRGPHPRQPVAAARAGARRRGVDWRDNQSGCKGVCEGLPHAEVVKLARPGLCSNGRCLDEGLLHGLTERLARWRPASPARNCWCCTCWATTGRRTSSATRRLLSASSRPASRTTCARCSREQIVNAYDNALLYTDHVLARADRQPAGSVGHGGHGHAVCLRPRRIAGRKGPVPARPALRHCADVQKRVPMVMWFSPRPDAGHADRPDLACLRQRAAARRRTTTCSTPCWACWT